jgi:cell division protein FtsB
LVQSMKVLQSCRQFARRNLSVLLGVGLLLLLVQDVFGTHGVLAMRRSKREAADIQKEINRLESENCSMEQGVESLKSDPQTIERIARDEMGLAKPGEYIFKLPPKAESASASTSPSGCPAAPPATTGAAPRPR